MAKTSIEELDEFGQSVWVDSISRSMVKTGKLNKMIELGLLGMTSNPTIFNQAISAGNDYDEEITKLRKMDKTTFEIYDELTTRDIQDAADIFLPLYKKSNRLDGYVSLEINPKLAYKVDETVSEGKRLFNKVNRPNVMFKVPSTETGFKAIEELVAEGFNINITLIFSLAQYINAQDAYLRGIQRLLKDKKDVSKLHSVASVFVSRVDTYVDNLLDQLFLKEQDQDKKAEIKLLKGMAARSNAALIYKKYLEIFHSIIFNQWKNKGANIQRVLWASTSAKNPEYSEIKYVNELIAKYTVNTMSEKTFSAFLDRGKVKEAMTFDASDAQRVIQQLRQLGIDIDDVCARLLKDGVLAFENSFDSLMGSLEKKAII